MVAHNSAILEEGYIYGAEYLTRLHPDLLMGGHSFVMDHPAAFIERYRHWAYAMRDCFRDLSSESDYRVWFDPFWLRAQPYRVTIKHAGSAEIQIYLRNFYNHSAKYEVEVDAPPGLTSLNPHIAGTLQKSSRIVFPVRLRADKDAATGVHLVAFDVTLDGRRFGQRFDCIVEIEPEQ